MEKRNNLISFLQAYLLCIGGLNQLLGIALKRSDGIMIMNLVPVALILALHFFTADKKQDLNMNKRALLFVYYIVSIIVVSKYAMRYTTFSYTEALVYCFIPIYLSFYKVDTEKLLKYMMLFSVLVIPFSERFFKDNGINYETIGMSTTYNTLPFVVAAIIHFYYYRKNATLFTKMGYIANAYYFLKIVFLGNRGPLISLMVLAMLLYLRRFDEKGALKQNAGKTIFFTLVVGIGAIYIVNNIETIVISFDAWLKSIGIELSAVSKTVAKMNAGDISNGRSNLFSYVLEGIRERWMIGHGVASITYWSNGAIIYPHNLFLQMWYDVGVLISIPLLYLTLRSFKTAVYTSGLKKNFLAVFIMLFTLSIPRLCYSSEFWVNLPFWLMLMYSISPNIYEEAEEALIEKIAEETEVDDNAK